MTNEQINTAIAETCGWECWKANLEGKRWKSPYANAYFKWRKPWSGCEGQRIYSNTIPDYCGDLNAMREAEKLIPEKGRESAYWFFLRELLDFPDAESDWNGFYFFAAIHSTPLQKAEAFLKVFGKWEE